MAPDTLRQRGKVPSGAYLSCCGKTISRLPAVRASAKRQESRQKEKVLDILRAHLLDPLRSSGQ